MTVTPAARAAATTSWVLASISVRSITSETAPWSAPPSDVKSFWYSIRTTAVVLGSTAMSSLLKVGACVQRLCLLVGEQHPDQESVALRASSENPAPPRGTTSMVSCVRDQYT